jgi:hypothetical protein
MTSHNDMTSSEVMPMDWATCMALGTCYAVWVLACCLMGKRTYGGDGSSMVRYGDEHPPPEDDALSQVDEAAVL